MIKLKSRMLSFALFCAAFSPFLQGGILADAPKTAVKRGTSEEDRFDSKATPVPSPFLSVFREQEQGDKSGRYSAYVSASVAQYASEKKQSASYFKEAVAADPENIHVLSRAFYQLLFAGEMKDAAYAAALLGQYHRAGLGSDNLVRQMATVHYLLDKDYQRADNILEDWRTNSDQNFVVFLMQAWTAFMRGDTERALDLIKKGGEIDAYSALVAGEHHAYMLDAMGRRDEALSRYQQLVIQPNPTSLHPYVQYVAHTYRRSGEQAARVLLSNYYERFDNNRFILREGMRIVSGQGPSHDATKLDDALSMLFFRLGSELSKGKSKQAALVYLKISELITPQVTDTVFLLASLLEEEKEYELAARYYARIKADDPFYVMAQSRLVEVLRQADDEERLIKAVDEALRVNPNQLEIVLTKADLLRDENRYDEALDLYNRVIASMDNANESSWYPFFARGVVFDQLDRWDEAEADFLQALSIKSDQAAVQNYLGYSWINRGIRLEEGRKLIEAALGKDPQNGAINDSLGWVYYLLGDYETAVKYLEIAVGIEAGDVTIHDHLGDAYWQVGRHIEARYQWRHAIDSDPREAGELAIPTKLANGLQAPDVRIDLPNPSTPNS